MRTTTTTDFTREQGLPHPIAMAVAQDRQGFIWIGTQGGLSRFDGYGFRTYLHRDDDPNSLPGDVISSLTTDGSGRLWIGTVTGEVGRYDDTTDGFRSFADPNEERPRGGVFRLIGDGGNGVWVASNSGLEHIAADGTIKRYDHRDDNPDSLPSDRVRAVQMTRDGTVWVSTYRGMALKRPGRETFDKLPLVGMNGEILDDLAVDMIEASDGRPWFLTLQSKVGQIADDRQTAVVLYDLSAQDLGGSNSLSLLEGRKGELWLGRLSSGVTLLDIESGQIRTIRHEPGVTSNLLDNTVRTLFKSRDGLVWAGTNRGVSLINPDNLLVDNVLPSDKPGRLGDSDVPALVTAGPKAWLGLKEHGVAVLDPAVGTITPLAGGATLPPGFVAALAPEPDGTLWIAAGTGSALYRIGPHDDRPVSIALPRDDTSLITALHWSDGALWVAAGPLMRLEPATKTWRVFRHGADPDSLADQSIDIMLPDGSGGLWLGTHRGLDHLDIASGKFRHLTHQPTDVASIPGDFITSLLIDRRGRLWVGTLDNGLAVAEPGADTPVMRFRRIGGLNSSIDSLLEDDQGRVWVGTDDGLAVIEPDQTQARVLGHDDGVALSSYWLNSAAKLPDGTLLFGGSGLSVVHPDLLTHKQVTPSLVVTDIHLGNRAIPSGDSRTSLILGPHDRSLAVTFAALDYSASDKLRYAYKLDRFDDDWIDTSHRVATYTNLSPGSYSLLLRATDRDGTWIEPLILSIVVQPNWWQSWWFRAIAGPLVMIAIYVPLVQGRTRYLEHRRKQLEELVASQTRDLIGANRQLQELASRDFLTNIYNRRYFFDLATTELERGKRTGRPTSLVLIDIDHFKQINDRFGHSAGDEVLRKVVTCIGAQLRDGDLFARIGGEELTVLLPETELTEARVVAERLRQALATQEISLPTASIAVTASFGLVVTGRPPEPIAELLDRADRALYAAKAGGRNRVEEEPVSS